MLWLTGPCERFWGVCVLFILVVVGIHPWALCTWARALSHSPLSPHIPTHARGICIYDLAEINSKQPSWWYSPKLEWGMDRLETHGEKIQASFLNFQRSYMGWAQDTWDQVLAVSFLAMWPRGHLLDSPAASVSLPGNSTGSSYVSRLPVGKACLTKHRLKAFWWFSLNSGYLKHEDLPDASREGKV